MARRTKAESEETRARILACACEQFASHGFAATGLDEIAAAAGVTRGAVYHHFGSRRGVFDAAHARAQAQVAAAVTDATEAITDPWAALKVGCRAFLDAAVREDVRRILLVDAPSVVGWEAWRELDAGGSGALLHDVLNQLERDRVIEVGSVGACQALLSGAMNEAALRAASSEPSMRGVEEAWPILDRMIDALRRKDHG